MQQLGLNLASQQVLSVSEVNQQARSLLEGRFSAISVAGEVSNLKTVSGHCYFSLKDATAQLNAVLFRREVEQLAFELKHGMQVVATGRLTIYAAYGRYQLVAERIEPQGLGALQAAFEQLKARLHAEGLFDARRKRALPLLPRRVAVVTSPTGAVIRDICNVALRRFPNARILVVPAKVQGAEAAADIVRAIERASRLAMPMGLDVLIVARGGGSLEDLWGFNDERVARAVAASPIPVVSGVGHETDFTICDFVADHRAPTPSAAAELVFPVRSELLAALRQALDRAARGLRRDVQHRRQAVRMLRQRLGDGRVIVREPTQRLAYLHERLGRSMRQALAQRRHGLQRLETRLAHQHPRVQLREARARVQAQAQRLAKAVQRHVELGRRRLRAAVQHLQALSPLAVLERGYAIVLGPDGTALKAASAARAGDTLDVRLAQGRLSARVLAVEAGDDGEA